MAFLLIMRNSHIKLLMNYHEIFQWFWQKIQLKLMRDMPHPRIGIWETNASSSVWTFITGVTLADICFFFKKIDVLALQWRHNEHDGVSNHQPDDCLLNLLFKVQIKKASKFRVTDLYVGNSPVTVALPAQRASNVENVCFHLMTSSRVKHRLLIHSDITGYFAGFTTLWTNGIKGLISIHFIPTDFKCLLVNLRNIFFL